MGLGHPWVGLMRLGQKAVFPAISSESVCMSTAYVINILVYVCGLGWVSV